MGERSILSTLAHARDLLVDAGIAPLKITVTAEAASRIRDAGAMVCRFASDEPLPHAPLGANERLVCVLWGDTTIVEQTKERKVRR